MIIIDQMVHTREDRNIDLVSTKLHIDKDAANWRADRIEAFVEFQRHRIEWLFVHKRHGSSWSKRVGTDARDLTESLFPHSKVSEARTETRTSPKYALPTRG